MRSKTILVLTFVLLTGLVLVAPIEGQRGGQQIQLPAGAGQELVQSKCTQCHGLNTITEFGRVSTEKPGRP